MTDPLTKLTRLTPLPGHQFRASDVAVRIIVQDNVDNLGNVHFEFSRRRQIKPQNTYNQCSKTKVLMLFHKQMILLCHQNI